MKKATSRPAKKAEDEIKIIHVRADGSEQESMTGVEVPVNEYTIVAYKLIAAAMTKN